MTDEQANDLVSIAAQLLDEIRGMRAEFMEFTGYNTTKMSDLSREITGETGYNIGDVMGPSKYSLEDLHSKLEDISSTLSVIDINTSV